MSAETVEIATMNEDNLKQPWQYYMQPGSEEYERANSERVQGKQIQITRYGESEHSTTLIASINIDPVTGEVISGHDYHPEAQSMQDIEAAFGAYLAETPLEQRLVIYEGGDKQYADRESAIRGDTEAGLLKFLAGESQVPAVSGEPVPERLAALLEQKGVDRRDLAALFCVWDKKLVQAAFDPTKAEELWGTFYTQAATVGLEGFKLYTEAEKQQIEAEGRTAEVLNSFKEPVKELVGHINSLVKQRLGRDLLLIDGAKLSVNTAGQTREELVQEQISLYNPVLEGELNQVAKVTSEARDAHLAQLIISTYEAGKSPFVAYGGSHIVCLKPVFSAYFNKQ